MVGQPGPSAEERRRLTGPGLLAFGLAGLAKDPLGVVGPPLVLAVALVATTPLAAAAQFSSLTFFGDGTPSAAGTLTVSGDSNITINVSATTGYVY